MTNPVQWSRRRFLFTSAQTAGLFLSPLGTPTARAASAFGYSFERVVEGIVRSQGRGVGSVTITDGYGVHRTASDGTFRFLADPRARFVYVSLPAGYRIPTNPRGTGRFYRSLPHTSAAMEVTFELESLTELDENHHFLLLADVQTENAEETALFRSTTIPEVRSWADNTPGEKFGVACGDIMFNHLELFPTYEEAVSETGIPFFQVVGNHDLDRDEWVDVASTRTFEQFFGPPYYSFNRGAVHYIVLDDIFWYGGGYIGYIDADQLNWLKEDLATVEPGRLVIVMLHIPLASTQHKRVGQDRPSPSGIVMNRAVLYRLLEPYQAHVLSAHTHENEHLFEGGIHEQVHGAVCGAWWTGPVCYDGTPCGYGVYEVRGEELRWRYQSTGFGPEHQMRLYRPGELSTYPDHVVANVWNFDPQWSVRAFSDRGEELDVTSCPAPDPLSIRLHQGPDLPPKRSWIEPRLNYHMFRCGVSPETRSVQFEVTDRFGEVYRERLQLRT